MGPRVRDRRRLGGSAVHCPPWPEADTQRDAPMTLRFNAAIKQAQSTLSAGNVLPGNFESWHKTVFQPVTPRGHAYYAGKFRQVGAEPCLGQDVGVGASRGSPCQNVLADMADLCIWIQDRLGNHRESPQNPDYLAEVAYTISCSIGSFIRIHPFINGNGRTSRLLWGAILGALGFPPQYTSVERPDPPYPEIMRKVMEGDGGELFDQVLLHLMRSCPNVPAASDDPTKS